MSTRLTEHLDQVTNAASLAARECTGLVRRLEDSDDLIALRNALPNLTTSVLEICGICYSLRIAFNNLDSLPPSRAHLRHSWVSDHYFLTTCACVLDKIRVGARIVPGFEAGSPHDGTSKGTAVHKDSVPVVEPLTPKRVKFFLLDLARLKGRLRRGTSSLDMYSIHSAISQMESIRDTSQNGSPLPPISLQSSEAALPSDPADSPVSFILSRLDHLNHPSENRLPFASYIDEVTRAEARNKTNPAYPQAATSWIIPSVNTEWKAVRQAVLSLFALDREPGKPGRANFGQWVLEFTRQTWPQHYDNRYGSGQPLDALTTLERRNLDLAPLAVAAAFGLSELCKEFPAHRELMNGGEWSIVLLSALLGPSTLLRSSTVSTWERINEPPFSIAQAETIRVVLKRGFSSPNSWFCHESPQPAPADYLAFLVALRLRDTDLFFEVLDVCARSSDRLADLLQPGPFWGVAASRYEPCASEESRAYLSDVLARLIERIFPIAEDTPPLSTLFSGAIKLAIDLNLPFTLPGRSWRQAGIPDERFAQEVRSFIRDENALAIRCLVQDPRWDPNLPYKNGGSDDGSDSGTILHMAAEVSGSEEFEILELIVESGADLERTDERNRTPIMLCEAAAPFRFLIQKGANTQHRDVDGRNCWHFAAANVDTLALIWLHRDDPNAEENMRGVNQVGHTPLTEAIFSLDRGLDTTSAINCILYLCAAAKGDTAVLRAPCPILHAAVRWGSEEVVRELIRLGVDPKVPASDGSSPLHHLNFTASPALINLLLDACAGLPLLRPSDRHSPIETMFLNYDPRRARLKTPQASLVLSSDVVTALLTPAILESKDDRDRGLWQRFCSDVVDSWGRGLRQGNYHAYSVLRVAIQQLARKSALRLYEEQTGKSGIPLFYQASQRMTEGWPTDIIISVYKTLLAETSCLDRFVSGPEALDLAGTGVAANAAPFLDLLLNNGVSVHQRPLSNGGPIRRTLLEIACAPGNRTTVATFEKLLEHAERDRLNDVDDTNQGLIHHLIAPGPGRDQKLIALLDKGANPNLMRWGRSPALVSYILERQHDAAMILLENRINPANPALATTDGMDAALAAASRGSLRMLEKIKSMVGPEFNWKRTCKSHFTIIHPGGGQVTTTASNCNALHLAAFNGFDIIVQFYCISFRMDPDHAIIDNMTRPVHSAAIGGSAPCIRVLHEYGADLTLRAVDGYTALHTAVRNSQIQAVKTLLDLGGARLNSIVDNEKLTPFMHALQIGFPNIIKLFADVGTFKAEANSSAARSKFIGQTIETVIRSGDLVQCKNLLAVTSLEDFETCPLRCDGCSPVMLAIREGNLAVLKWLLEEKCTGLIGSCPVHFRRHVQPGYNALINACDNPQLNGGLPTLLMAYLRLGLDWTSAPVSPIHAAARANNLAAIKIILDHIVKKDLIYRQRFCFELSNPRRTLQQIKQSDREEMIRHVLNQRVISPDTFDLVPGWTPLHISTSLGHDDVTLFLLQQGVDIHAEDDARDTPLHIAVKNGNDSAVRILLRHGAHKTRAHGQGFAPLMAAVEAGNVSMAEVFVKAGADKKVVDMDGMSLLNIAGERPKSPAAFHYLVSLGGLDPYRRDKAGYMSFDDMILNIDMLGYVLNRTFDFTRMTELSKGLFSLIIELNRNDSVSMLKRLLRRLPAFKVRDMINTVPKRFVSPLCAAVHRDIFGAIDVLVGFGADVNVEGSMEGTPLMTACSRGRLESVKILVGHGAWVAYTKEDEDGEVHVRSAVDIAVRFPEIQKWLLVGRYTERNALTDSSKGPAPEVHPWSGPWAVAHRLQGSFTEHPRSPKESRLEYLIRTAELRRTLKGRVLRGAELVRPSGEVEKKEVSTWDVERVNGLRVARAGGFWRITEG